MNDDPWTAEDPQPGDFEAFLASIDPATVELHDGDPAATLRLLVSFEGEDALRLARIARQRGKAPHEVVADLLRRAECQ